MRPAAIIHRHFFTVPEVAKLLLGEHADDCDAWEIRCEDGEVIVDVIGPVTRPEIPESAVQHPVEQPPVREDAPKGGPLAQKAGILCGEKAFQVFLEVKTPEAAAEHIRRACNVDSRAKLDHDAAAGRTFQEIASKYGLWMDGYDVE